MVSTSHPAEVPITTRTTGAAASAADLTRLEQAVRVVLDPLSFPSQGAWKVEVVRSLKRLLGADRGLFLEAGERPVSEEWDIELLTRYRELRRPLEHAYGLRRRELRQGVYTRASAYGRHLDAARRTTFYNEYIVPHRAYDALGCVVSFDGREADLLFNHETLAGRRFGARGVHLLRVLRPAFEAGLRTARLRPNGRHALGAVLDALDAAVLLASAEGKVLHQNRALVRLIEEQPQPCLLRQALATALADAAIDGSRRSVEAGGAMRHVRTGYGAWIISIGRLSSAEVGEDALLLTVTAATPRVAAVNTADLSPAERRVAHALTRGLSNTEIARELFLSVHTTRHHVERILSKLGARNRTEAAAMLLAGGQQRAAECS